MYATPWKEMQLLRSSSMLTLWVVQFPWGRPYLLTISKLSFTRWVTILYFIFLLKSCNMMETVVICNLSIVDHRSSWLGNPQSVCKCWCHSNNQCGQEPADPILPPVQLRDHHSGEPGDRYLRPPSVCTWWWHHSKFSVLKGKSIY